MATRVYSPAGEPFDIPRRDLADKLILQDGWTQTPPVVVDFEEEVKPKPKRRSRRKKAEEVVEAADAAPEEEPVEEVPTEGAEDE